MHNINDRHIKIKLSIGIMVWAKVDNLWYLKLGTLTFFYALIFVKKLFLLLECIYKYYVVRIISKSSSSQNFLKQYTSSQNILWISSILKHHFCLCNSLYVCIVGPLASSLTLLSRRCRKF